MTVAACACLTSSRPTLAQEPAAWQSLVDAEIAFAADAGRRGISPAFLAVLDAEAVVLQGEPVNGVQVHRRSPAPPEASLWWHPRVAEVAASGDLGYTSGAYVFRSDAAATPSYGHYVSVWQRAGEGPWKIRFDGGVQHAPITDQEARVTTARLGRDAPVAGPDPRDAVAGFSDAWSRGAVEAAAAWVAEEARIYSPGRPPEVGASAAGRVLGGGATVLDFGGGGTSAAGDLHYRFGTWRRDDATGSYLHIWRLTQEGWRIVLLLDVPAAG